jgi:glutathione synthase/RimK-type ligase-like ATP-grasp enzyme
MTRFALLAHPGSRRALGFAAACRGAGHGEPRVVSWQSGLAAGFDPVAAFAGCDVLRIDTPADDPAAERLLLARGAAACEAEGIYPFLPEADCKLLPDDDGRLRYQRQWYLGFCRVLEEIGRACGNGGPGVMSSPGEIATLFDKLATRAVLLENGVPVPPAAGLCTGFEDLVSRMDQHGWRRVFLKPCHGSSAAGVMAVSRGPQGDWQATSSAVLVAGEGVRNSKKPQVVRDEARLRGLVDAVCRERALVERWFPKATLGGRAFDLRVLVIGGQAAHVVVRTSRTPITNLHLANSRGDLEVVKAALGPDICRRAMDTAEAAAACFPGCHHAGVDLMIGSTRRTCAVAEVNAFGDLLHRELWQGMDPWQAELARWP